MFVVVSDAWCGAVQGCPAMEGSDVVIGCYGQYDWLSFWLQYNPVATISSSISFVQDRAATLVTDNPDLRTGGSERPPYSRNLTTSYTFPNVRRGDDLFATCQIEFTFDESSGYSGRNRYADNPLYWQCNVTRPVNCEYFRYTFYRALTGCHFIDNRQYAGGTCSWLVTKDFTICTVFIPGLCNSP